MVTERLGWCTEGGAMRSDEQRTPGTTGVWRVVRGAAVGAAATGLALGGHAVAGASTPPLQVGLVVSAVVGAVTIALSRVQWTVPRLLTVLLLTQIGMHVLFAWSRPAPAMGAAGHVHVHAGDGLSAVWPLDLPMVSAHVAAAVLTAVLLSRGEAWLCAVLAALGLRALRLLRSVVSGYGGQPAPAPAPAPHVPRQRVGTDSWWERGPPR